MAGNRQGGLDAASTNKLKYGDDFYKRIGAMGGRASKGGFTTETARIFGAIGGSVSRRGYSLTDAQREAIKKDVIRELSTKPEAKKLLSQATIRKAARAVMQEQSQLQVSSLSAKYGKQRTW